MENTLPRRVAANPTQYNISKTTDVSKLASELEDKLPEE
jgi:hypothetical protein